MQKVAREFIMLKDHKKVEIPITLISPSKSRNHFGNIVFKVPPNKKEFTFFRMSPPLDRIMIISRYVQINE